MKIKYKNKIYDIKKIIKSIFNYPFLQDNRDLTQYSTTTLDSLIGKFW